MAKLAYFSTPLAGRVCSQLGFPSFPCPNQLTVKPGKSVPNFMHVPLPLIPQIHLAAANDGDVDDATAFF